MVNQQQLSPLQGLHIALAKTNDSLSSSKLLWAGMGWWERIDGGVGFVCCSWAFDGAVKL